MRSRPLGRVQTNLPGSSDLASVVVTALDHKYYDQLLCVVSTTDAADEYYPGDAPHAEHRCVSS